MRATLPPLSFACFAALLCDLCGYEFATFAVTSFFRQSPRLFPALSALKRLFSEVATGDSGLYSFLIFAALEEGQNRYRSFRAARAAS